MCSVCLTCLWPANNSVVSFFVLGMLYSRTMNVLSSLKHRPFALLWTGQTTSRLGDSLYRIALSWWVLEKTGSAVAMGTVLIFSQVPMLIFLLIGGVVVGRLPRIRIMFSSDVLSGLVITFVTVFAWLDLLQIWHIYLASMLFGFVEAFFFPAYQAVIPQITPSDLLNSANSLNGFKSTCHWDCWPRAGCGAGSGRRHIPCVRTRMHFRFLFLPFVYCQCSVPTWIKFKARRLHQKQEPYKGPP